MLKNQHIIKELVNQNIIPHEEWIDEAFKKHVMDVSGNNPSPQNNIYIICHYGGGELDLNSQPLAYESTYNFSIHNCPSNITNIGWYFEIDGVLDIDCYGYSKFEFDPPYNTMWNPTLMIDTQINGSSTWENGMTELVSENWQAAIVIKNLDTNEVIFRQKVWTY